MYLENEKDIINDGVELNIADDGTVSWDEVLSADDEIVSIKSQKDDQIVEANRNLDMSEINVDPSSIDLGDELEFVNSQEDDIDDDQLKNILTSKNSSYQEEFDIDKHLSNAVNKQEISDEELLDDSDDNVEILTPSQTLPKSSFNPVVIVMALVFCCVLVGIVYFIMTFTKDKNIGQNDLVVPTNYEKINNVEPNKEQIPIVNEENANEVEVQEEKIEELVEEEEVEEKKQTISVQPTGRTNPFMPIQKYIMVAPPVEIKNYSASGVPLPPPAYGTMGEVTTKLMSIAVSGIMYDPQNPSAIITYEENDYFVQKGDKLDDYKIIDIGTNYVTISLNKNIYKANVGESFKIATTVAGSADFMLEGRQYHTISAQEGGEEVSVRSQPSRNLNENRNASSSRSYTPQRERYTPPQQNVNRQTSSYDRGGNQGYNRTSGTSYNQSNQSRNTGSVNNYNNRSSVQRTTGGSGSAPQQKRTTRASRR